MAWPRSCPLAARRAAACSAPRASCAPTASSAANSSSASATPSTASTSCVETARPLYVTSCSSVPSASRKEPVAWRASRATASAPISMPSSPATRVMTAVSCSTVGRPKSKRWQRSTTVGSTFCASVVASTKIVFGGGSSRVLRNAFHACWDSMCASSRM